jgi:type II secretory pathway component GspD/PulD (secretin)
MKTIRKLTLLAGIAFLFGVSAEGQSTAAEGASQPMDPVAGREVSAANGLRLNFHGAPLEAVLNYLSEAAGFVIILEAQPSGTVDVWSERLLTKEEALELLNSVLLRNGYATIRKGRILTIVKRDEAKTKALPVVLGSRPESIPRRTELVTQILPIRFTEASQLLSVLQPLVSSQTTMTANESANTLVITDTQDNIHRLAEVIQAVENGAEDFTVVKVFHLRNGNPTEMEEVLSGLFAEESQNSSTSRASGFPDGGFGGGPPGMGGGGGFGAGFGAAGGATSAGAGSESRRLKNRSKVTVVSDQRTQSIIVTASRDLMPQIEAVVRQLDDDPNGKQSLALYQLRSASPTALAAILQATFQKNGGNNRDRANQNDPLATRSATQSQQSTSNAGTTARGTGGGARGGGSGGAGGP